MPVLFLDIETRSTIDLEIAGAWRYAADPTTEIMCVGYAVDDGPIEIWTLGQPVPAVFFTAAVDPEWSIVTHNVGFDRPIMTCILQPHGFPHIAIAQYRCTMVKALAAGMPGGLDSVAAILGLPTKDAEAVKLMRRMARPRRRKKNEDPAQVYWEDSPELRKRLHLYLAHDTELVRLVDHRLPHLSPAERENWALDALINERGFAVDTALAIAARAVAHQETIAINTKVATLTNGAIRTAHQVKKITAFVRDHGHRLEGLTKRSVAAVLAHDPGGEVQQLLELRQRGAKTSARKFNRLLASVDSDGRLRGTLRFFGAKTGRWSGRGYQPQNLRKVKTDISAAVDAILSGDMERVRALGAPITLASEISRAAIIAQPGYRLIGGDLSAIESRILSLIAGETWKIDSYCQFDITGDAALEPYCITASRILKRPVTPDDEAGREIGKTCDLAFGFGGGVGAWRKFDHSDTYSDADVEAFKSDWRREHAATVRFWHGLERAAHRAIRTGQPVEFTRFRLALESGTLFLTLPSGRRLSYPQARLVPSLFEDTWQIRCKDNARGGWTDRDIWYGTLTENVVQAIARDLLAAALQRLEAAGYPIVLHVHDEAIAEVPEGFGGEQEFVALMLELPDWAAGLPIAAKPWSGKRYVKTAPMAVPAEPASAVPAEPVPVVPAEPAPAVPAEPVSDEPDEYEETAGIALADLISEPLADDKKIRCPFHDGDNTPSCHIYADHFHCFACDAHGDLVDWLMQVDGMSHKQALEHLANWSGPVAPPPLEDDDSRTLDYALQIWDEARPIAGTPAADYLARRGVDLQVLPENIDAALRFHARCPFNGGRQPCLVMLLRDVAGDAPAGIHRIGIPPAWVPGVKVERQMLGRWSAPRAVKIWPATSVLVVGEGLETVLAAATRIPYRGEPLQPAWATISAGNLGRLPVVPGVDRLVVLVDHDRNGAGQAAAVRCAERWSRAGRTAIRLTPKSCGADFNDLVLPELAP